MTTQPPSGSKQTGDRIRAARISRDLSLAGLSAITGFSVPRIGTWERGEREISVTRLVELAGALEVPPAALLPDGESMAPSSHDHVLAAAGWLSKAERIPTRAGVAVVAEYALGRLRLALASSGERAA